MQRAKPKVDIPRNKRIKSLDEIEFDLVQMDIGKKHGLTAKHKNHRGLPLNRKTIIMSAIGPLEVNSKPVLNTNITN